MKQKIVIKIQMSGRSEGFCLGCILRKSDDGKGFQTKVLKNVAETFGVISVALEGDDKVVVIGDGIDATKLTRCLRKKVGHANIVSLEEVKEKKEENKIEYTYTTPIACTPSYYVYYR
ncbi:hypothetical protein CRYUN_Cryun04dG0004400 [Craigia yunnanensis]